MGVGRTQKAQPLSLYPSELEPKVEVTTRLRTLVGQHGPNVTVTTQTTTSGTETGGYPSPAGRRTTDISLVDTGPSLVSTGRSCENVKGFGDRGLASRCETPPDRLVVWSRDGVGARIELVGGSE